MHPKNSNSSGLRVPRLRLHRPSGQAVVTLADKDHYLGRFGSKEAKEQYRQKVAEWLAAGSPRQREPEKQNLTVGDVVAAYWRHLEAKLGEGVPQLDRVRRALRPVVEIYQSRLAVEFGPRCLKAIQQELVQRDLSRTVVNERCWWIKRMFRWAAAEELVPGGIHHSLSAVTNLRRCEFGVREGKKVGPVDLAVVEAVLPYLSRQVAAMVMLQWWSGCRPGEAAGIRPCDIDRSGKVWIYTPAHHKTEHHGRQRVIPFGPQAQEVLRPFLNRVPAPAADRELFSPAEAEQERLLALRANRQSKVPPSQRNRRRKGAKQKMDAYSVAAYRRGIDHGIEQANAARMRAAAAASIAKSLSDASVAAVNRTLQRVSAPRLRVARDADNRVEALGALLPDRLAQSLWGASGALTDLGDVRHRTAHAMATVDLLPHWHPHQLRHSAGTRIRKDHGLEGSRVVLGHTGAATTELYAEIDIEKALRIALMSG